MGTLCVICEHAHRKVGKLAGKMNISSWAGCCRTPKSTTITMKNEHQFLGRMLQNTEKYENYHEKSTSVLGPDVAAPKTSKSRSFIVKIRSRALQNTEKYENYHEKRTSKKLKSRKSTKIYRRNPFLTLSRAPQITAKYENYHEK